MSHPNKHSSPELISGPTIPTMEVVHDDDRRTIREVELKQPNGTVRRMTHLAIKGPAVLGNHYHNTPEHFSVINGEPRVLTAPHDNPEAVKVKDFPEGGHVTMAPGEVHAFHFPGKGDLISSMDGAFDPTDMHPQKLEAPEKTDETRQG